MDDLQIDVERIRANTERRWKAANRSHGGFLGFVDKSVSGWLIIIASVMYLLSAPHTAAMFDKITPGFGWAAPLGVEFGLLYAAFRRKRAEKRAMTTPTSLWVLVGLLFVTAIAVNGAGALSAAVSAVGIQNLSLQDIRDKFGTLPVLTQVALFLVALAALMIPLATTVAGEGLAALFFDRDASNDDLDRAWKQAEWNELRLAFFAELTRAGMKPADARRQAQSLANAVAPSQSVPTVPLSLPPGHDGTPRDTPTGRAGTKQDEARRLLAENPELSQLSYRKLQDRTGINKNVWQAVISSNGYRKHDEQEERTEE